MRRKKAKTRILITISTVILVLVLLCSCSSKTAKTAQEFTDFAEDNGFTVSDVTEETETNGLVKTILLANCEDYQLEFLVLNDADTAESVFYGNVENFDSEAALKTSTKQVDTSNYNYYEFVSDDMFCVVSRVEDTMLLCVADKEFKDDILEDIKQLGY